MTRPIALVVEDDPSLQVAMVKHLARADIAVLPALDFSSAVRHLTRERLSVACIDLGLPSESGYELCEHIRSRPELSGLPILVTSERSTPEIMAHAEEAGANAFLRKPFSMKELLVYVSALLDGPPVSWPSVRTLRLAV
jgi:two-component system, sensor histidine kinase ChiS